jgi:hypothetical protein
MRTPLALGGQSLLALWLVAAASAQAQSPQPPKITLETQRPKLEYRSALSQYQRFTDAGLQDWRSANETVNRIGGWREYARMAAADAAADATSSMAAVPKLQPNGAPGSTSASGQTIPTAPARNPKRDPHQGHRGGSK